MRIFVSFKGMLNTNINKVYIYRNDTEKREKVENVQYKKATVIPDSDLTLERLHSIQPGRKDEQRQVCVGKTQDKMMCKQINPNKARGSLF